MKNEVLILAIESSCDETSCAVSINDKILANVTATQAIHASYGGVVPELASRAHQIHILPVVHEALKQAGINKNAIHAVAFTQGPGLLGSLLVGGSFAKSFAQALQLPLLAVNHMQAHVLAHFIRHSNNQQMPQFPFLCLTVSGGHTQIVLVKDYLQMEVIGQTLDDAAGEAFDKAAKFLGLPYPGGPLVDKYASEGIAKYNFALPQVADLNFSFSGLKTGFLNFINKKLQAQPDFIELERNHICASIQQAIITMLMQKLSQATLQYNINQIAIAGGVSANKGLRKTLQDHTQKGWHVYIPPFEYCTDNAAMIAIAGYYQYLQHKFVGYDAVSMPRFAF
ncbi:MAG: tRNA (adenosine(37)-N6)-threonylcarbamoyltransferase complex transferase subunit TsaD [Bacteroidia bacterium]|nr:tRNA (adenosine(37)-N6)-threonylcarbamoyltransferase complex transferase subunit TsaD [Bacteroidia bacterium]